MELKELKDEEEAGREPDHANLMMEQSMKFMMNAFQTQRTHSHNQLLASSAVRRDIWQHKKNVYVTQKLSQLRNLTLFWQFFLNFIILV